MRIFKIAFPTGIRPKWDLVDWSKTNEQIANEEGFKLITVKNKRREFAPETTNRSILKNMWKSIDKIYKLCYYLSLV